MSRDTIINICNLIEIGCVLALGGMGLHAINKWAKADRECARAKEALIVKTVVDESIIRTLEKELEELRGKTE